MHPEEGECLLGGDRVVPYIQAERWKVNERCSRELEKQ